MPTRVVVTEPEFVRPGTIFRERTDVVFHVVPSEEAAVAAAVVETGARHAIVGPRPYRDRLYDALGRGSVLARFGVGYDGIDLAKASAAGILCTNTPGTLDQSVAEITMLFVAAAARHLVALDRTMRERAWSPRGGIELEGRTLAVIGAGRIGTRTAAIARRGFGMRVVGCRRSPGPIDGTEFDLLTTDFSTAVRDADFVVLLIPGSAANAHFLDKARLAMLPERAWLINTARGSVVDEVALYDALAAGRLAGAAIDVFEREPYEPIDPNKDLRSLDNVILVPHVGSNTTAANRRMSSRALANIELALAGRTAEMDLLNPEVVGRQGT